MNIAEIAKLAGVSRATVSRYLNDGYVSEEKKEKIRAVIEKTGYVPSSQARMLRTKRTKLIGVILPKISSETIGKIVDGISERLAKTDYHLILASTENNVERELEYLNIFKSNQVDGIIFSATILTEKHRQAMRALKVPIVIVGQDEANYCSVFHDDYAAAKEVTQLLIDAGCRSLGYIGVTKKDAAAGLSRYNGFMDQISAAQDKNVHIVATQEGDFTMELGYACMKQLLDDHPKIDGVFCATDRIAIGAVEAIKDAGLRVPEDISVVGIGGGRMLKVIEPNITTAQYFYQLSGREAASMLLELIGNETPYIKKIKLGYEIVKRQSVKTS